MSAPCHHRAPFAPPAQAPSTRCGRPTPGVDGFGRGGGKGVASEIKAAQKHLRTQQQQQQQQTYPPSIFGPLAKASQANLGLGKSNDLATQVRIGKSHRRPGPD